jgi:hypothetical protein
VSSNQPADPYVFTQTGTFTAPFNFDVPASLEVRPETAHARFDGTGAGGDFLACLSFYDNNDNLICRQFDPNVVQAGDVADVSFIPPFGSAASSSGTGTGIQFDTFPQTGDWLEISTTGERPTTTLGVNISATDGNVNIGTTHSSAGGVLDLIADGTGANANLIATGANNGGVNVEASGGNSGVTIQTTNSDTGGITIEDHAGGNGGVFVYEDGDGGITIENDGSGDLDITQRSNADMNIVAHGTGHLWINNDTGAGTVAMNQLVSGISKGSIGLTPYTGSGLQLIAHPGPGSTASIGTGEDSLNPNPDTPTVVTTAMELWTYTTEPGTTMINAQNGVKLYAYTADGGTTVTLKCIFSNGTVRTLATN